MVDSVVLFGKDKMHILEGCYPSWQSKIRMRPLMKLFKEKKGINVKTVDLYINMYSSLKKTFQLENIQIIHVFKTDLDRLTTSISISLR